MNRRRRSKKANVAITAVIVVAALATALAAVLWSAGSFTRGNQATEPNKTATTIQSVVNSSSPSSTATSNNYSNGSASPVRISNVSESPKAMINVVSSPSALPFVQRWVAQYNLEQNKGSVNIVYSSDADRTAVQIYSNVSRLLSSNSANLAIVGGPQSSSMSPSNNTKSPSLILVPVSPHAVAIVYNIPSFPDIPSGLQLDPTALVKIFTGKVTYWDDPAIKSLNSNLNLPHEKIVVVHLNKAESSTDLLTQYLASNGTKNNQIEWTATSQIVPDATALSSLIQRTPYSIGYIDYAYAVQTKMTYAALQNSDGKFSLPSQDSISRAIQNGTVIGNATNLGNLTTNSSSGNSSRNYTSLAGNSLPVTNIGHIGNGSYPIVGLYFAGFFLNNTATSSLNSNATNAAVQDFANWIVGNEGQRLLQDAQYPSIYDSNLLKLYLKQKLGIVTQ